jgi:hypothetical protein
MGGEDPVRATVRTRRRGLASAVGAAALLTTAGCGIEPTGVSVVGAPPAVQGAGDLIGGGSTAGAYAYYLYFFRDGHLAVTTRYLSEQADQDSVLKQVLAGPTKTELAQGYSSEIPAGLSLITPTWNGEAWAYQFSNEIGREARAEIVCSIQANTDAPSVATVYASKITWDICWEDFPDLGAPAFLPNSSDTGASSPASPSPVQ